VFKTISYIKNSTVKCQTDKGFVCKTKIETLAAPTSEKCFIPSPAFYSEVAIVFCRRLLPAMSNFIKANFFEKHKDICRILNQVN